MYVPIHLLPSFLLFPFLHFIQHNSMQTTGKSLVDETEKLLTELGISPHAPETPQNEHAPPEISCGAASSVHGSDVITPQRAGGHEASPASAATAGMGNERWSIGFINFWKMVGCGLSKSGCYYVPLPLTPFL